MISINFLNYIEIVYVTVLFNISVSYSNLVPRIMNPCITFYGGMCVYSRCILPTLLKSWWFRTKYVVLWNMQTSAIDLIRWIDLLMYLASTKALQYTPFITKYNLIIMRQKNSLITTITSVFTFTAPIF